ncbi:hypothetical protein Pcinc_019058, partial [Petrolisthes cinctipes]
AAVVVGLGRVSVSLSTPSLPHFPTYPYSQSLICGLLASVVDGDGWRQIENKQTRDVPGCHEDRVHAFSHPPCTERLQGYVGLVWLRVP